MRYVCLSTTSKHNRPVLQLPNKIINGQISENFLVNDVNYLEKLIQKLNSDDIIITDIEDKGSHILYEKVYKSNKIDYKPNDLTMEAADLAIFNYFNRNPLEKTVGIYGTGNIAFKLALRLSERNFEVHIFGRNREKIKICVDALKQVTFNESLIIEGNYNSKIDAFIPFVSAEEVITEEYIDILNVNSLCLDGGIGNFSKGFIKSALDHGHEVRRLDVRQSQEIMDGYVNSRLNSQFDKIIGRDEIGGYSVVAGGIIGQDGEVIVDNITNPQKVIGIANGIGGVKSVTVLNDDEKSKIQKVQQIIQQDI